MAEVHVIEFSAKGLRGCTVYVPNHGLTLSLATNFYVGYNAEKLAE